MICPNCQTENRPAAKGCRRCQRALPTLSPGDVVADRFEILELLGTGGMGVVFKARDRSLDETVGLKTLRQDLGNAVELGKRFRSEIRLARKVSSPHICRIHEFGIHDGLHYISMEYVEGVTLKEYLEQKGPLPPAEAFRIARDITTGLSTIHGAGIIHRDVKPANLMRTPEGLIKLMDFGIAKEMGGVTLTAAGQAVGTPQYMSPEHVMGLKLDPRADVYTAGLVVFELLAGTAVFHGKTPIEIAGKQVQETPNYETPGIPPRLVPVLQRALSKDRNGRYATARELGMALEGVEADLGLHAPPPAEAIVSPAPAPRPAPAPPSPETGARRRPSTAESQAMMPPPVDAVIKKLRGHDPIARRRAVLTLAELGPHSPAAVQALAEALSDREDRVRFMAAAALGRVGPAAEPAVPALLRALDDEAAGNAAADSLVKIGKAAVPGLLAAMTSGRESVSLHAASALTRIGAGLGKPRSS